MKNFLILLMSIGLSASSVFADEGMWTLNNFPSKDVKQKYNFDVTPSWLDHVRLSSARLAGGCSASFVSPSGLVMTNHHCAHSCIEQLSTPKKDYVASGFYAKNLTDEVKCPEIEVNKLMEITDVTAQVRAATKNSKEKDFNQDLKAVISQIEKDCAKGSDSVRCDVVTLYHGGQYNLYRYQRYQDVRLVFAPEFAIAFFGGDPDNFNFPRYDLDVSFLRVYENDKPLVTQDYFKWSESGAQENDLSFVTGNPGNTSRLLTVTELGFIRDFSLIDSLTYLSELRGYLTEFQNRGAEQKRISNARLFGIENSLKAIKGRHEALIDPNLFNKSMNDEKKLRAKVDANPKLKKLYGTAWKEIDEAYVLYKNMYNEYDNIERTNYGSRLFGIAKSLVRAAVELPKKNELRFKEYTDSQMPQAKQYLFSTAPIYDEFEIAMMTFSLTKAREKLGPDHPFVKMIFGKKSPAELAQSLIKNTTLKDVKVREKLFNGGQDEVLKSKDPLILLALQIDPEARRLRTYYEENIESKIKKADEKVAQAQFAVYGANTYPDATFTMRISYGAVQGYDQNGKHINPITKISGAFERQTGSDPFALPESWMSSKDHLNSDTPFNFCSTNDIIGGNSGSPVINKNAEVIGLIFDGNIQSLGGDYAYDGKVNRAVAVHSSALIEALDHVYGAQRIVNELKPQPVIK
ncbi:MAG: S46 family peptidase [Pseudobdellovibrio sp.]